MMTNEFPVERPAHYHAGGIDVFAYARANAIIQELVGYHRITVIKYVTRAGKKDDIIDDLKKAKTHIDEMIDILEDDLDGVYRKQSL